MANIILPEKPCQTAKEFLSALSPIGEFFHDTKSPWLFRGQGKDYDLIPSLFRRSNKISSLTNLEVDSYESLRKAEWHVLIRFFHVADKRGLVLPDDSQELRSLFEKIEYFNWDIERMGKELGDESQDRILSIMALAQHYGIPTRLLDWTMQSYYAAFFAAEDAYKHAHERESAERLVVWSLYFPTFRKQMKYTGFSPALRGVTAPSATNPNLRAQQGVFTLSYPEYTKEKEGIYLPLNLLLEEAAKDVNPKSNSRGWLLDCKMRKFTLPVSEVTSLLHLLARFDITPSSIYPGYQSIKSDLEMQKLWE